MIKISHIVNPVKIGESSDLFVAQPITFESMRLAKDFASAQVQVQLLTTQYSEDHSIIPAYFEKTPDLDRSVLDFGTFQVKRKLPLIKDILQRAIDYGDSDYIIYTNVDIALMPHFYSFVHEQIKSGYDSFVINRRTISNRFTRAEQIALMYAEIGNSHPGFDCFVFKRELFNDFVFKNVCIGTTRIGLTLISNLILFSRKFYSFENSDVTFHLGEDQVWLDKRLMDFVEHNEKECIKVLEELRTKNMEKFDNNQLLTKHFSKLKNSAVQKNSTFFKNLFKR